MHKDELLDVPPSVISGVRSVLRDLATFQNRPTPDEIQTLYDRYELTMGDPQVARAFLEVGRRRDIEYERQINLRVNELNPFFRIIALVLSAPELIEYALLKRTLNKKRAELEKFILRARH